MGYYFNVLKCSVVILLLNTFFISAQEIQHVEPPFWWTGMKNQNLQLLIHGDNISDFRVSIPSKGIIVHKINKVENPNYLFLDLKITEQAKKGKFKIEFKKDGKGQMTYDYELKSRREGSAERRGFTSKDVLYLITPDRFANGDSSNDEIIGMPDTLNRGEDFGRHGGDVQGILNHLDYIKEMGFTSIWVNPILENNQPNYSYHGYAITDFYKVDPRYGSNEDYLNLVSKAKEKSIGVIMDMILNHCGHKHWWMDDLPTKDWINHIETYLKTDTAIKTNHQKATIQDPYLAQTDYDKFVHGWFTNSMPDMNVINPYLSRYLIQNSIWWIEYADLQGIRMDTYSYPDKEFMTHWTCEIMHEYPNFNIVGEEWNNYPQIVSFWQRGKQNPNAYTSCLPSLMDFPVQVNLVKSLNASENNWTSGWKDLYETLAMDFLYPEPFNLVVFPDNHDMSRIFTQVNEDIDLFKNAIAFIATSRGIPQYYYGTEILMANPNSDSHGEIRSDFPGGWESDDIDAKSGKGLNEDQKNIQNFMKKILNWRKNSDAIHNGKLIHYAPEESMYIYFRYTDNDMVMTILSKNDKEVNLDLSRFSEMLDGNEKGVEIINGKNIDLNNGILVPAKASLIIDFE